jgi:hypothetical protein
VQGLCCCLRTCRVRRGRVSRHGRVCLGRGGCCESPADPAQGQRPAGTGLFSQRRRRSAASGRAGSSWDQAAMTTRAQRSACSGVRTLAAVRPRARLMNLKTCS